MGSLPPGLLSGRVKTKWGPISSKDRIQTVSAQGLEPMASQTSDNPFFHPILVFVFGAKPCDAIDKTGPAGVKAVFITNPLPQSYT